MELTWNIQQACNDHFIYERDISKMLANIASVDEMKLSKAYITEVLCATPYTSHIYDMYGT